MGRGGRGPCLGGCKSRKTYRSVRDRSRARLSARQSVQCVPVMARCFGHTRAVTTSQERSQTRIVLALQVCTTAAHGDVDAAQSDAGALRSVRGEEKSRLSLTLLCCSRCAARPSRIVTDADWCLEALWHEYGMSARRIHGCSPSVCGGLATPEGGCMVHGWLGEFDTVRPCAVGAGSVRDS